MKFSLRWITGVLSWCAAVTMPGVAQAQPLTTAFTYQGELKVSGTPASGLYDLRFRLYDAAVGGAQIGSLRCADNVSLTGGRFTVDLDFLAVFAGQQRFLEIDVRADTGLGCGDGTGYTTLAPRQPLTAAPYAQFALNATTANFAANAGPAGNAIQLNGQFASFYLNASNIAGGTVPDVRLSPNVALLDAPQTFSASKTFSAAPSFTAAGAPFSVANPTLVANLNADLLDGLNSTAFLQAVPNPLTLSGASGAHTIRGTNTSTQNGAAGVIGWASGATGVVTGVRGNSESSGGIGVEGYAIADGAAIGGKFVSQSTSGTGVYGQVNAFNGVSYAGYFLNGSDSGTGVYASVNSATGATYGGKFVTASTSGIGVYGSATATTGASFAGQFVNASTTGTGLQGTASAATGVNYGVAGGTVSTTGYGVYGQAIFSGPSNWGVFAQGRSGASGTKSFRIDHPDDPENKYLLHYSAESPEVINFYSGRVILDAGGAATVELPAYFAKINRDPRYQLTCIGAFAPIYIASEIDPEAAASSFRIAGGLPGMKVSWEVKAVRNDLWVQKNGAPVEVEKQGPEKGTYQHPELYGQPQEKGMNWSTRDAGRLAPAPPR